MQIGDILTSGKISALITNWVLITMSSWVPRVSIRANLKIVDSTVFIIYIANFWPVWFNCAFEIRSQQSCNNLNKKIFTINRKVFNVSFDLYLCNFWVQRWRVYTRKGDGRRIVLVKICRDRTPLDSDRFLRCGVWNEEQWPRMTLKVLCNSLENSKSFWNDQIFFSRIKSYLMWRIQFKDKLFE